jgi:hypothetical protein
MQRLILVLMGVLLLMGQPALSLSTLAADEAAGVGCVCGKKCCVSRSEETAPRVPAAPVPPQTRFDATAVTALPVGWSILPPTEEPSAPTFTSGLSFRSPPVPIYDRDCSYLI